MTPAFIKKYYKVSNDVGSMDVTQAVYETMGEGASPSDLVSFQQLFELTSQKISQATDAPVYDDACYYSDCGEGNLDVQYIMGIAQNTFTIYDYWSSRHQPYDWMLGWITSVAENPNPANTYSISYGGSEQYYSQSYINSFNTEAIKLGVMGTTIVVASGDDGAGGYNVRNSRYYCGYNAMFPASSPYVLTVGATNGPQKGEAEVACQSGKDAAITSGGGFSALSTIPSWQSDAVWKYFQSVDGTVNAPALFPSNLVSKRGYPDVSLLGHNYAMVMDGSLYGVDGTSASAPVMAAFISLVNAQRLKLRQPLMGFINPFIYQYASHFIMDITSGDNRCAAMSYYWWYSSHTCCKEGFNATIGWDPVTGLGSIDFDKFSAAALRISKKQSSSSKLGVIAIVFIVIGVIIGVFLIIAAGVVMYYYVVVKKPTETADFSGYISTVMSPLYSMEVNLFKNDDDEKLQPSRPVKLQPFEVVE